MSEQILCVSFFDAILGPRVFYCSEEGIEEKKGKEFPDLGRILEFNEDEGSFIFAGRKYQTLNHIFYIHSPEARGGKDLLMITYMIKAAYFKNEITDVFKYLEQKKPVLQEMADDLADFDKLPLMLHQDGNGSSQESPIKLISQEMKEKFLGIFEEYFEKIFLKMGLGSGEKPKNKKIFIFGPKDAGKSTFIRNIEAIQFHHPNPHCRYF